MLIVHLLRHVANHGLVIRLLSDWRLNWLQSDVFSPMVARLFLLHVVAMLLLL